MAHDLGIGVIRLQGSKQGDEGCSLGRGPGIGSAAFLIQASFIADTDGMGIVMAGMHTDLFFITGLIELAVLMHNVLAIRYPCPSFETPTFASDSKSEQICILGNYQCQGAIIEHDLKIGRPVFEVMRILG